MDLIFVIGPSRSGTSLVYDILNAHPDVAILYEVALMHFSPMLRPDGVEEDWAEKLEMWNDTFARHGLSLDSYTGKSFGSGTAVSRTIYADYAKRFGAKIGGEKLPAYCDKVPLLAEQFPEAKFIFNWRNPRHTLRSIAKYRHTFGSSANDLGAYDLAFYRYDQLLAGVRWLEEHGRAFVVVDYDQVVQDAAAALAPMWRLLALKQLTAPYVTRPEALAAIPELPHNAAARSGKMVSSTSEAATVPEDVLQRLDRWVSRWTVERVVPGIALPESSASTRFSFAHLLDRLRASLANARLNLALLALGLFPVSWWRAYRSTRRGS